MKLTSSELMEQRHAKARNGRADSARHARLILPLAEGFTRAAIRAKLDCSDSYINRLSGRFATVRPAGLLARHAGRHPCRLTERVEARGADVDHQPRARRRLDARVRQEARRLMHNIRQGS
jgi:hypothetical protein